MNRNRAIRIILVILVGVGLTVLLMKLELFDRFYLFSRRHETWELDELILTVPAFLVVAIVYAYLTTADLKKEIRRREMVQEQLSNSIRKFDALASKRSDFVSIVSHEIRTPLNGIFGLIHMLDKDDLPPEMQEQLAYSKNAVAQLTRIISDVMEYSKFTSAEDIGEQSDFSPITICDSEMETFRPMARGKDIQLRPHYDASLVYTFHGHAEVFRKVLHALLNNAVEFTDSGSVDVNLTHRDGESGERLVLEVKDTGRGMPPEALDLIFLPYFQLSDGLTRDHGGIGIGLSLANRLAERVGAVLSVSSQMGQGSVFTLSMPVEIPPPKVTAKAS